MNKSIIAFFFSVLVCSCSASVPVKKDPVKAPPSTEQEFRTAEALAKKGDYKKAMPKLAKFVKQNPVSDLTANAYFLMGQLHANAQQYPDALNDYMALVSLPVASPLEAEAALRAARIQLRLSQPAEAEKNLERASRSKNLTGEQALELEKLRFETSSAQKKLLPALESLVALAEKSPLPADREKYKTQALESIDSRISENDLREIADSKRFSFLQPQARFRYGLFLAEQRQYSRARDYLSGTVELAPGTEIAERANYLISQIDSRNHTESRTVGVVLPLTGKQAGIGYKALHGIQMGLGIYGGHGATGFKLAVIDSEGNPDAARRAVERLVQEDNVIAIIGGLLSKTASAEAAKAQEFGVPAIMLTQKSGVTQAGDFIFRNALTSQMQVQYLVETAMTRLGYRNFAIMYPNDAYGVEFANLFWDEVRARGGDVRGAQVYDAQETDFRGHVQRLVGTFYLEDRTDEYRLFAKAWSDKNPKRSSRQSAPAVEELLPPIVDFDAVFIPDSAKAVGQIAPMLAYNNVSKIPLLGTNLWNSPGLVTRGQRFVENSVFVDSFLATDPTFVNSEFFTGFKAAFDEEPGLTEIQAYDSALILRQLITGGESSRSGLSKKMASLENFPGAIGRLSVNSEREFRRPLTSLTVRDGHITGLDASVR